jgi:uncharacterized phage protein gp47/JayE
MIEAIAKVEVDEHRSRLLGDWTARTRDDYGIAVLEMWAYLADILTFYQERIANEAFLRTALLRESVLRLAALLDYEPAPGVSATAYLAFTLEEGRQVQIPVGLRVQSVPGQDEKPQKFEIEEPLATDAQLNQVRIFPKPEYVGPLDAESTEGFLEPQSAPSVTGQPSLGDQFVVFFGSRDGLSLKDGTVEEKEVTALRTEQAITTLTWEPEIQSTARDTNNSRAFRFTRKFRLFGFDAPTRYLHPVPNAAGDIKFVEVAEKDWTLIATNKTVDYTFDLPPIDSPGNKLYLDAVYDDLNKGAQVLIPVRGQSSGTVSTTSARSIPLYRLYSKSKKDHFYTTDAAERNRAIAALEYQDEGIVGYIFSSQVSGTKALYRFLLSDGDHGDHFYTTDEAEKASMPASSYEGVAGYVFPSPEPGRTPLYRLFHPGAKDHFYTTKAVERDRAKTSPFNYTSPDPPGSKGIACYIYASNAVLTTVTDTREVATQKGPLNATVTEITLKDPIPPVENLREIEVYELAGPEIRLRDRHYRYPPKDISGSTVYVPLSQLKSLERNRPLILDDEKEEPQLVTVTGTEAKEDHLAISFTPGLPPTRTLDAETAVLFGNVAKATHGETVAGEVLGGGDASAGFQSFQIRKSPVTFVSQPGAPHGAANTLRVRIDGVLWDEVGFLFGRGKDERVYTTSVDDENVMTVRFGNGTNGARLPTGRNNVVATYRQGLGRDGKVGANALTTLLDRPVGLRSVTNPLDAQGSADPESLDKARSNAPNTVRTFGRIVSLRDFEDAAREFEGVAKARATWEWDGSERVVRLVVAGDEGDQVANKARKSLAEDLNGRRDPYRKLEVESYEPVFVEVEAVIQVDPALIDEDVRAAALTALLDYFAFDNLDLGQPIHLSNVYRVLQDVGGVTAVDVDCLQFKNRDPAFLASRGATADALQPHLRVFSAELARIEQPVDDAIVRIGTRR